MDLPVNYDQTHYTVRKLVREEYERIQGGNCWFCNCPLSGSIGKKASGKKIKTNLFPKQFFKWPKHLHHDRKTGLTIGTVHAACNAVLWQYHGQ